MGFIPEYLASRCQRHPARFGGEAPEASSSCRPARWCRCLVESDQMLWSSAPQLFKDILYKSLVFAQRLFIVFILFYLVYPSSRHACFSRSSISISIISSASLFDILFRKETYKTQVAVSFAKTIPKTHEHKSEEENVTKNQKKKKNILCIFILK